MAIGVFLDTLPTIIFVVTHIILLLVGLWTIMNAKNKKLKYASAFWLYVLVHVGFLSVFGGLLTLKMGVFIEQILIVIMVLWISMKA